MAKHARDEMLHMLAWNHDNPDAARHIIAAQNHVKSMISGHVAADAGDLAGATYHMHNAENMAANASGYKSTSYHQSMPRSPAMRTEGHWQAAVEGLN